MHQRDLHRAIAQRTGETISEIARRGFSLADPLDPNLDPEPLDETQYIDWDQLTLEQNIAVVDQPAGSLVGHI
jgi:hypothetical protein